MRRMFMALWRRDVTLLLRSPAYALYLAFPVVFSWLFDAFMVDGDRSAYAFAVLLAGLFGTAMGCALPGLYVFAEDREYGVPETLLRAGVPARVVVLSKFAASVFWGFVLAAVTLPPIVVAPADIPVLLAALTPAMVTVSAANTACASLLRSQASTSVPGIGLVVLLLIAVMAPLDRSLAALAQLLPANLFVELVMDRCMARPPTIGVASSAAVCALWLAASLGFLLWASHRFDMALTSVVAGQPPEQQRERDGREDDPHAGDHEREDCLAVEQ